MAAKFAIAPEHITVTGFYRSNLHLHIRPVATQDKHAALLKLLLRTPDAPCVVYVTQQDTAERVASALQAEGLNATAYHAGIENERRQQIQDDFMRGRSQIIVATIAFGMGIDKSNIRQVIHYDLPKSIENYSQEIGRAGRDGETSLCTLLGNREGLAVLENFVYGDTPELAAIAQVLTRIQSEAQHGEWEMTIYDVSAQSNIRQLPLKTLLVYLEIQGLIEPLYSYYSDYRFTLNIELDALLGHFKAERQEFVRGIFRHAKFGRSWYQFDFASFAHEFPEQRARAVTALEYMDEKGWLRLEVKQMTEVYRVLNSQFDPQTLAASLYAQFAQKERSELQRLSQMLALFETTTCLSHALAAHFGDEQAPMQCGHCLVCRGKPAILPAADSLASLNQLDALALTAALREKAPNASIHVMSCFLCGITLPTLSRVKASKMPHFGQLAAHPFATVRAWLEGAFAVQ